MNQPLIANIQRYSIHDGRGIRTTAFFKGCPLACKWCHNPETQSYDKSVLFYRERCEGCGACAAECGYGAVRIENGKAVTQHGACAACGVCVDRCLYNARELCGRKYGIPELAEALLKDRAFYETSGGGVTLSGGEVLAQDMDYVEELMRILTRRGISVNIDTCGAAHFEAFERVLPYTDTFLYDLKLFQEEEHRKYTGVSNREILENLKRLSVKGADIWIRIPVIGGVNDTESEIGRLGGFLKDCAIRVKQINLIPYHNTGAGKYARLDRTYDGAAFCVPKEDRLRTFQELLMNRDIAPVLIGG